MRINIHYEKLNCLKFLDPSYISSNDKINYFELAAQFHHEMKILKNLLMNKKCLKVKLMINVMKIY